MIISMEYSHVCCFTGHRPERLDMPEEKVKKWLEEQINKAIEEKYTDFISGMQRGVDLWAAEIVLRLKKEGKPVRLIAASAFKGMENRWDQSWKDRYNAVLADADEVNYISDEPGRKAFFERNKWMVDHSRRLIAVYTGAPGGTQNTINYARKEHLDVYVIGR